MFPHKHSGVGGLVRTHIEQFRNLQFADSSRAHIHLETAKADRLLSPVVRLRRYLPRSHIPPFVAAIVAELRQDDLVEVKEMRENVGIIPLRFVRPGVE